MNIESSTTENLEVGGGKQSRYAYDSMVQFSQEEIRKYMRLQGLAGEENISSSFFFSGTKDSSIILHEKSTGDIVHGEENGNPLSEEKGSL